MSNTIQTTNPATGETLTSYTLIDEAAAKQAVLDCHEAFLTWSKQSIEERLTVIKKIGEHLAKHTDRLSQLMSDEMGKKPEEAEQEIELCVAICDWMAEHAADELADEPRELEDGKALITYQPIGVILGIQPWNFPAYQVIRYSIANLAAGNMVLLKHAQNVWGSALMLEEIYHAAGIPKHAFKVLQTDHDAIEALIPMPEVRGVTLTGSDEAGQHIAKIAGEHLKKTVLELGSNDAYIILADADLEKTVELCVQGRINNTGQTCIAAKRFIVVDDIYEQFREHYLQAMQAITTGDPKSSDTDMGPMARDGLRDTLHQQVQDSVAAGATLTLGGEIPDGPGYFYPATILENVSPGMPAYDDELFGPVAALIRVRDTDEAMHVANDSRYGLGGGIFSQDVEAATALARERFDTGMVNINTYQLAQPNLPFGGVKDSGYGREHGGFGLHEFVNIKTIMIGQ